MPLSRFSSDTIVILGADGERNGPYLCVAHGGRISVFSKQLKAHAGDIVERILPTGRMVTYEVLRADFVVGTGADSNSWLLEVRRCQSEQGQFDDATAAIDSSLRHAKIDEIAVALQSLLDLLEAFPVDPVEIDEAKALLTQFLDHSAVRKMMEGG